MGSGTIVHETWQWGDGAHQSELWIALVFSRHKREETGGAHYHLILGVLARNDDTCRSHHLSFAGCEVLEGACGVYTTSTSFSGCSQDGVMLETVWGVHRCWMGLGVVREGKVVAKTACGVFTTSAWFSGLEAASG